jgi:hypothetical protein
MHVTAEFNAIKKCGHFKDNAKTHKAYVEHKQAVTSARSSLALLGRNCKVSGKSSKSLKKAKEAKVKAKEAKAVTEVAIDPMKAAFQVDLEKAKKAAKRTPRVK